MGWPHTSWTVGCVRGRHGAPHRLPQTRLCGGHHGPIPSHPWVRRCFLVFMWTEPAAPPRLCPHRAPPTPSLSLLPAPRLRAPQPSAHSPWFLHPVRPLAAHGGWAPPAKLSNSPQSRTLACLPRRQRPPTPHGFAPSTCSSPPRRQSRPQTPGGLLNRRSARHGTPHQPPLLCVTARCPSHGQLEDLSCAQGSWEACALPAHHPATAL